MEHSAAVGDGLWETDPVRTNGATRPNHLKEEIS